MEQYRIALEIAKRLAHFTLHVSGLALIGLAAVYAFLHGQDGEWVLVQFFAAVGGFLLLLLGVLPLLLGSIAALVSVYFAKRAVRRQPPHLTAFRTLTVLAYVFELAGVLFAVCGLGQYFIK